MIKIVVACGSGVVTSAIVARYVADFLDAHGYAGRYELVRCSMADAPVQCADADFLIATTVAPRGITCEYVSGVPFLSGRGKADAEKHILDLMARYVPAADVMHPRSVCKREDFQMTQATDNPQELFGMRVAHVGINAKDPDQAAQIANDFSLLMGLPVRETPISVFSGTLVETMKENGRGTHGHIGFHVDDLEAAVAWFAERGLAIDESSRKLNEDGSTRLVYFDREIGGFAIHLTTD